MRVSSAMRCPYKRERERDTLVYYYIRFFDTFLAGVQFQSTISGWCVDILALIRLIVSAITNLLKNSRRNTIYFVDSNHRWTRTFALNVITIFIFRFDRLPISVSSLSCLSDCARVCVCFIFISNIILIRKIDRSIWSATIDVHQWKTRHSRDRFLSASTVYWFYISSLSHPNEGKQSPPRQIKKNQKWKSCLCIDGGRTTNCWVDAICLQLLIYDLFQSQHVTHKCGVARENGTMAQPYANIHKGEWHSEQWMGADLLRSTIE